MTSLSEAGGGPVGREPLARAFLAGLQPLVDDLRDGRFAADAWRARQLTSGLPVRLEWPDGAVETLTALDVDPESGALLVRAPGAEGPARPVLVGEIRHLRVGAVV
jgi:biotin-(acetyl-CoA carboxylase) ligase